MTLTNYNTSMTGSEVTYTIPDRTISLMFQPIGGDVVMRTTATSGATWTIKDGAKELLEYDDLGSRVLYFTGAASVTLQSRVITL